MDEIDDEMERVRPQCCKAGCTEISTFLLGLYTDDGFKTIPFCIGHALDMSSVLERIIQSMMGAGPTTSSSG